VTRICLLPGLTQDFERIFDFLFEHAPDTASDRIAAIVEALNVLATSPLIGRPAPKGLRELVIATGASGYLALYRYRHADDEVDVVTVRSQLERGYRKRKGIG